MSSSVSAIITESGSRAILGCARFMLIIISSAIHWFRNAVHEEESSGHFGQNGDLDC